MKKVKIAFKQFFSSLWEDFVGLLKKHYLKFIGLIICFIVPVAMLLGFYVKKVDNATKYTIPFAVVIPLVLLLFIYWGKARSFMKTKINAMRVQNSIEAGKHAGAIILYDTFKALMTVLPFALGYLIVNEIQKYYAQVSDIFLFITICEAVGGFFCILDTIHNTIDYNEEESNE